MRKQYFSTDNLEKIKIEKWNISMKSRHGYIRLKNKRTSKRRGEIDKSKFTSKNKCFA